VKAPVNREQTNNKVSEQAKEQAKEKEEKAAAEAVPEELTGAGQIEFMRELAVQKKKERQEELERDEVERKALAAAKLEEVPLCSLFASWTHVSY
jgi:hypothetical protein